MQVSFSYPVFAQTRILVQTVSKKSFKNVTSEIKELENLCGEDAVIYVLRCLFEEIDFQALQKRPQPSQKDQYKVMLLLQEFNEISTRPNFASTVCTALQAAIQPLTSEFLALLARTCKMTTLSQLQIGLGVANLTDQKMAAEGIKFLKSKLDLPDVAADEPVLHKLLAFVRNEQAFSTKQKAQLVQTLGRLDPGYNATLAPLLVDSSAVDTHLELPLHSDAKDDKQIDTKLQSQLAQATALCRPADLLQDLGYNSMSSVARLRNIFSQFPRLTEDDVATIISMMVRTHTKLPADPDPTLPLTTVFSMALMVPTAPSANTQSKQSWDSYLEKEKKTPMTWKVENFVQALREVCPRLNWLSVYQKMDTDQGFHIPDQKSYVMFVDIYKQATQSSTFPLSVLFEPWVHRSGQLSILRFAVTSSTNLINFLNSAHTQRPIEGLHTTTKKNAKGKSRENSSHAHQQAFHAWYSLDLLSTLFKIGESELYLDVRSLLLVALERCPELLLCGIVQLLSSRAPDLPPFGTILSSEFMNMLMPMYLGKTHIHANSVPVLQRLWSLESNLVLRWILTLYHEDRSFATRALDIANDLKEAEALNTMLESPDLFFSVDLTVLASRREFVNLEVRLHACVQSQGDDFARVCVNYLLENLRVFEAKQADGNAEIKPALLTEPEIIIFFKVLMPTTDNKVALSEETTALLQTCHERYIAVFPGLASESNVEEIEEEANSYFQEIYAGDLALDDVIVMLKEFQRSENQRKRDVYACMIHSLFDEYRFFGKYPLKELQVTGVLFGKLIQHKLIQAFTLGLALRFVLEALRKPEDNRMFLFGKWALEEFKHRVNLWPDFCTWVVQIQHLQTAEPELYNFLMAIVTSQKNETGDATNVAPADQTPLTVWNKPEGEDPNVRNQQGHMPSGALNFAPGLSGPSFPAQDASRENPHQSHATKTSAQPHAVAPPVGLTRSTTDTVVRPNNAVNRPNHQDTQSSAHEVGGRVAVINSRPTVPETAIALPKVAPVARAATDTKLVISSKKPTGSSIFAQAVNINALLQEPGPEPPDDEVRDRMHFTVNNITRDTVQAKATLLKKDLIGKNIDYFCHFLVVRRVCMEPNNHDVYASFVAAVGSTPLTKCLVRTTYAKIQMLLSSDSIHTQASQPERTLLKHLGAWLGLLTLARNKPLLARSLDLKELIIDAYERSRLIAVIPFARQVLSSCAQSRIFKPPNPWLMAILSLLKEINDLPALQMKLKFEIEVLFRDLDIGKNNPIKASTVLRNRQVIVSVPTPAEEKKAPVAEPEAPRQPLTRASDPGAQQHRETVAGTSGDPNAVAPGASPYQVQNYFIAPNLIKIPLSISLFQTHSFLKKFVALAIDRAIREIISPVVDRSVTIACFTTRELVSKDFAVEGDEKKMRRAAHQMVQNLTSSLALVTCKEHLRGSIVSHLRSLLMDNSNPSELKLAEVEDACEKVALRNLDLGCQLIEKAASDRAVSQIDEALAAALRMRRVHREQTGQMFCDMSVFQPSRFPPSFPDFLRPKPRPEGLSATQLRVYEDFTRIRQGTRPSPAGSPYVSAADGVPDLPSSEPMPDLMKQGEQPTNRLRTQSTLDRLLACLQNVEHAVSAVPNHRSMRLASLGRSSMTEQIHSYLSMIPVILNQTVEATDQPPAEVMALTFANKVFKQLYDREHRNSLLQVDVHLHILECVRHKYPKVVNELTMMLLYTASDDRKFLIDITCGLIRVRMLVLPELDQYVAKLVHSVHHTNKAVQSNGNRITLHPHLEFAINLVRRVVVKESTVMATELPHLIEALRLLANAYQTRHAPLSEHLSALIDEMRLSSRASEFDTMKENITRELKSAPVDDDEPELEFVSTVYNEEMGHGTKQTILAFLDEWMSMATSGFTESSNTLEQFLERLHKSNMFSTPKTSVQFFCVVAQACVEAAYVYPNAPKSPPPGTVHNTLNAKQQAMAAQLESQAIAQSQGLLSYMAIDALSRLIVWLVKELDPPALGNSSPQNPLASRINLLSLFLTAVVCIMLKDFEAKGERFNQRPYLRLLSGLLTDLNRPDPVKFDSNQDGVLLAFANCLRLLRPTKVPVFAFAWIELLAHRMFMSKMLFSKEPQCQIQFQRLLLDLFVLMQPYLHNAELTQSIKLLYNGTLRILLVLLHDFPQFLCDFHFSFCDVIPPTCIQLRNLILSAFPKNMSLPDPFTPDLQMEALDGIQIKPRIVSEWYLVLKAYNAPLVTPLVQYIQDRGPPSLFDQITRALSFQNTCSNPVELARTVKRAGTHYNLPLINSMVLYLGGERPWTDACMDVFKALMTTLDAEGRYYVLSAIVNQLRYPNNHTYQFSRVLLSLFLNTEELIVKEQITRVLLERLIVHSPHPWGLLITFIELIKHEQYDFWAFPFIHCSPDIKRLFDCVARSCMQGPK